MYIFIAQDKLKLINKTKLAEEIGVSNTHLNRVLNQRTSCSKTLAYCITKVLDKDAEILDFFKYSESE